MCIESALIAESSTINLHLDFTFLDRSIIQCCLFCLILGYICLNKQNISAVEKVFVARASDFSILSLKIVFWNQLGCTLKI